jgi:hypothetical protein
MNAWHLDDHPDIQVDTDQDGTPQIGFDDQVHMLKQGITLSRIVRELARSLPDRPPICCITTTNQTCGTFRFHQLRPGESLLQPGKLDAHATEQIPGGGIPMTLEIEDHPG